jgi:hypothetical protein
MSGAGSNNFSMGDYPYFAVLIAKAYMFCRKSWAWGVSYRVYPCANCMAKVSLLLLIYRS